MDNVENEPYSRHVLWAVGGALAGMLVFVLGLSGYRFMSGQSVFLLENVVATAAWIVPYAVFAGPIVTIPMRDRPAAIYGRWVMVLVVGITLPHLYFLFLPKTPANAQAGVGLFLVLFLGGLGYLLLWGVLAIEKGLSG
jgi:hypothetical protein